MSPDLRIKKMCRAEDKSKRQPPREYLGGSDAFQGWMPSSTCPIQDLSYFYGWLEHAPYAPWWDYGNLHDKYHALRQPFSTSRLV